MNRRDFLTTAVISPLAVAALQAQADPPAKHRLGLVIHSYWVRRGRPLPPEFGPIADPLDFLEHAATLGAPGAQTSLTGKDPVRIRDAAERLGLYVEGIVGLPRDDTDVARFEADIVASRAAGATILRTVCLSGRRYETFDTQEQFQAFAERSWKSLTLAEPVAAKHGVKLAVENHKDWRIGEMTAWLKRLSSEHVGVCLDTGNSVALLEDPQETAEAYAPWVLTTHVKDMAVASAPQGFLLSEVPLGEGFVDLPKFVATLRKVRPEIRINLEMITRDPLVVPCHSVKYWETMRDTKAYDAAARLSRILQNQKSELPRITGLKHRDQLRAEAENIQRSIAWAKRL